MKFKTNDETKEVTKFLNGLDGYQKWMVRLQKQIDWGSDFIEI